MNLKTGDDVAGLLEMQNEDLLRDLVYYRTSSGSISPELLNVMRENGKKLENEKEVAESLGERSRERLDDLREEIGNLKKSIEKDAKTVELGGLWKVLGIGKY
ncbi:MAG: hypothetical protein ABEJ56_03440 [Candidatus Nanohaloarchaea archaeon]